MKHLVWGIIGIALGSCFLLGRLLLVHPTFGMGMYGGVFLAYGIYRIKQYRNRCNQEHFGPDNDPLKKWNIF
jgi:hypothetical protein